MRENIIEQIRFCATHFSCDGCGGDCKTGSNEPRTKAVLNDAADAIEELLAAVPHWISVEERLPEYGERALVSNGGFVCESFLSQSGKWQRGGVDMFFMTPTHWMPLPRAPKEVTDFPVL